MSALDVTTYSSRAGSPVPRLFSVTREFDFLSRRGELIHRMLPVGPLGYTVVSVTTTGHFIDMVENDRVAFSMPLNGRADVTIGRSAISVRPGSAIAVRPGARRSMLLPAAEGSPYRSITVIAPAGLTQSIPEPLGWTLRHAGNDLADFRDLLRFAFVMAGRRDDFSTSMAAHLERLVQEMFWHILSNDADSAPGRRATDGSQRLVRQAQTYIHENFGEPLSVQSIAETMGISPRTLQTAFAKTSEGSPRKYLTDVRVEEMRKLLLAPTHDTSVTSAAMHVGLVHIGRASQAYRARYGELPSETLNRSRGKAG